MPEISRFFGIVVRMFYDEHNPPHFHVEYQGNHATFDFDGNVIKGNLNSRTARKLVREWVDFHFDEITLNWELARDEKELNKIDPLD